MFTCLLFRLLRSDYHSHGFSYRCYADDICPYCQMTVLARIASCLSDRSTRIKEGLGSSSSQLINIRISFASHPDQRSRKPGCRNGWLITLLPLHLSPGRVALNCTTWDTSGLNWLSRPPNHRYRPWLSPTCTTGFALPISDLFVFVFHTCTSCLLPTPPELPGVSSLLSHFGWTCLPKWVNVEVNNCVICHWVFHVARIFFFFG